MSYKISNCANFLLFQQNDQKNFLLNSTFCSNRFCLICSFLKARKKSAELYKILQEIEKKRKISIIHLSLPYKKIEYKNLKENLAVFNKAFNALKNRDEFKNAVLGYFRITNFLGDDLDFESSFDCFLIVGVRYFKNREYISRAKWQELWQNSLGFKPDKNIVTKRINAENGYSHIQTAVYKIRKCLDSVNERALNLDSETFEILVNQTQGIRQLNSGGLFKATSKFQKEKINMANVKFEWNSNTNEYELK